MLTSREDIRGDIERSLDRCSSGSIEIRFNGGVVTVRTDDMRWWRGTSEDDIRAMADRLALAVEDPTLLLGTTNTGDWHKDSAERRARRKVEVTIGEHLQLAPAPARRRADGLTPSNGTTVDVLMPMKEGAYVRGDVVKGLLAQDRPIRWFIDAGPDLEITREQMDLFAAATPSAFWRRHVHRLLKILVKRNRLSQKGSSPLVYLADSDVILPPRVFGGMADALVANDQLGATGLIFQVDSPHNDTHVPAGAMMLRRKDLGAMGPLRGSPCECSYIRNRLADMGKVVVPVGCVHAHQWKRTVLDDTRIDGETDEEEARDEGACPKCGDLRNPLPADAYVDVRLRPDEDGTLSLAALADMVGRHGERFRLFVDGP